MNLSLKWKIQLWHAAVLAAVLTVVGIGYYYNERFHRLTEYDFVLNSTIHPIVHQVEEQHHEGPPGGPPPGRPPRHSRPFDQDDHDRLPEGWSRLSQLAPPGQQSDPNQPEPWIKPSDLAETKYAYLGFYVLVWDRFDRTLLYKSTTAPDLQPPPNNSEGYWARTRSGRFREMLNINPREQTVVGFDLQELNKEMALLKWEIAGVCFLIFLIGTTTGGILVGYSLRPLKPIYRTTEEIAAGKLDRRIPKTKRGNTLELTQLTRHLNENFAKLESLFAQQVRFTADASHELKNPLTALIGRIALGLKKERTPGEYRETLESCQRSAEKLNRIVTDLLDLSRYDSGMCKLECEDLPLDALIQSLADDLQPHVTAQGGQLKTELRGKRVYCDPFRMEQVITNLVNNALQHNPDPVEIVLRTRQEPDAAVIEVIDNGTGIKSDNLDKLFDRFFHDHTARKNRNHTNIGLGLAICHAIVTAHGGTLSVASTPRVETRFTIRLPLNS